MIHVIYNVYFHPLSKFPGPKLAAASGQVFLIKWMRGFHTDYTIAAHERYGPVVRIGPGQSECLQRYT